ncbi:MAG: hypothetical protein ABR609_15300, partial [Acidimicrobiia bacterium]
EKKVAALMMEHFSTDATAASWFVGSGEVLLPTTTTAPDTPSETSIAEITTTSRVGTTTSQFEGPGSTVAGQGEPTQEEPSQVSIPWPAALTGVGVGLALGSVIGYAVVRRRSRADFRP